MTTPALIQRVESARGPDRELDRDVFLALFPNAQLGEHVRGEGELIWNIEGYYKQPVPDLSSSLDAAVSLCARVKPGWGYVIRKDDEGHNAFLLFPNSMRVTPGVSQHETSPALALVLAVLRAVTP